MKRFWTRLGLAFKLFKSDSFFIITTHPNEEKNLHIDWRMDTPEVIKYCLIMQNVLQGGDKALDEANKILEGK